MNHDLAAAAEAVKNLCSAETEAGVFVHRGMLKMHRDTILSALECVSRLPEKHREWEQAEYQQGHKDGVGDVQSDGLRMMNSARSHAYRAGYHAGRHEEWQRRAPFRAALSAQKGASDGRD